ncbi:SDR family NAD(P)-dependent oxidoreductase [Selenomonas ruminantium]|uniref:UDP-glucuronate 4-epimerase n=1 Tax=Selenomonas ruminantium TaxID=971 RepID=A0A1I0YME1_SELRU|nr:SDR family NAD(P)-dependent oxidoreductase [Selenomonas ruminantium]SFB13966.1 UDP-glucuronate 4-epimerase [Selenomonas ruminantium]
MEKIKLKSFNKILVTGAAGFIGFHLSKKLLEAGCQIIGVDNLNNYYSTDLKKARLDILEKYQGFCFNLLDISDYQALEEVFRQEKLDIVVNLAAQAGVRYSINHPREYINSNICGFFNILEVCRYYPVKHLVYASSSSVYGNQQKIPFSVDDKTDSPISLYAATKKADELMAYTYSHLYGIPATGLRFFTVYGPYGRPDMAYFKFADALMENRPIRVYNNGDMLRDFTYVDDVVEAVKRIISVSPSPDKNGVQHKVYNVGNNHPEKLMDFIVALEEALGKEAVKEYLPMQQGDVYQTYADVGEFERDFGFKPSIGIKEGLNKFAEWYLGWRAIAE